MGFFLVIFNWLEKLDLKWKGVILSKQNIGYENEVQRTSCLRYWPTHHMFESLSLTFHVLILKMTFLKSLILLGLFSLLVCWGSFPVQSFKNLYGILYFFINAAQTTICSLNGTTNFKCLYNFIILQNPSKLHFNPAILLVQHCIFLNISYM